MYENNTIGRRKRASKQKKRFDEKIWKQQEREEKEVYVVTRAEKEEGAHKKARKTTKQVRLRREK